ncbi:DegT/DnrJ/EryC1/StrS aminotransferase family protein [Nocardioides sp. SYSU D00038]|uniref:DegT/DnrJ/EryC1/StrS family aminotransferase n=1 Tax=Nocardioides sp. SYSU D00038 TaxID=2812554 RepID=UPI00196886A5|nr:DegT/DnrJ/EryC1/StrS family aminotransferase [Nocardioides sp. SYSU D00038]
MAAPSRLGAAEADAVRAAVARVVGSDTWVGGAEVAGFEAAFASYLGTDREVVGCGNGSDALALALGTLHLPAGAAVIVAPDDGGYAAGAARQLGLAVRVMDVDPDTGVPTAATAAAADAPDVAAVVVTHLHGDAVPLSGPGGLDEWRRARGLALVEDCAQAHGLRVDGSHVGLVGDAATFSFYPTKNLGAVGDAGAVVLPGPSAERARRLREHGWGERHRVVLPGGRNSRLDPVQAAVLTARLPFLDDANARRRAVSARYRAVVGLHGDPATTVAHHAVALVDGRDRVATALAERGVATAMHYPWLVTEMPGLAATGSAPAASGRRDRKLSLPCFPGITDAEVDAVVAALEEVVR